MASLPTSSDSHARNRNSSTQKQTADDCSNPKLREKEEMSSGPKSRRSEPAWSNLVACSADTCRLFNFDESTSFDELTDRGVGALRNNQPITAVHLFDRALRIRISEEGKSGPESVKTMLKYADEWFLKGQEISERASDLRLLLQNMTQKITNEILQSIPDNDSAEKDQILSIIAQANSKESSSALVDHLRKWKKRKLKTSTAVTEDDGSVSNTNSSHLADTLNKEVSLCQADQDAAGCPTNPPPDVDKKS